MNVLVRDTQNPNKDPFLISPAGFEGLRKKYGNRYQPATTIDVHKEAKTILVEKPKTISAQRQEPTVKPNVAKVEPYRESLLKPKGRRKK